MTYKLVASNFELCLEIDEDSYSHFPAIQFDCLLNNRQLFQMLPEQGAGHWKLLADACRGRTNYSIDWSPCNGESNINVSGNDVTFCVAKFGDGCGGQLSVTVPSEACVEAFEHAAQITTEWMQKK